MRRKDLFLMLGFFLSAVFGAFVGTRFINSDSGVQKLAFARASQKTKPRQGGTLHKGKSEEKGAKTWKEPPYDYIDGHLVGSGYTNGQVLKYNSAGAGTWEPENDNAGDAIPSGAVMFFDLATCPTGWSELTSACGRYVIGLPAGGTLAATVGTALSNTENRPVGQHNHGITDPGHTHIVGGATETGGPKLPTPLSSRDSKIPLSSQSATTGITINNAGTVAGTNAPYIQCLICKKD